MASLGFPGIVSISFHSTAGLAIPGKFTCVLWAPGMTDETSTQGKLREGQSGRRKSISVTIEMSSEVRSYAFLTKVLCRPCKPNGYALNRKITLDYRLRPGPSSNIESGAGVAENPSGFESAGRHFSRGYSIL
jgi:hypothetical protein